MLLIIEKLELQEFNYLIFKWHANLFTCQIFMPLNCIIIQFEGKFFFCSCYCSWTVPRSTVHEQYCHYLSSLHLVFSAHISYKYLSYHPSHNSHTPPLSSSSPKFKRESERRLFIFCRKISVSCQLQAWIWRFFTHFLSTISSNKLFTFLFSSLSCICMLDLIKSWPRYLSSVCSWSSFSLTSSSFLLFDLCCS